MNPPDEPLAYKDAVFLSPHKFIGGPGTPGVLAMRRSALQEPRAHGARRRHRDLRQRARAPVHRRSRAARGGRHARHHREHPRGAGVPAQGGRRARTSSASARRYFIRRAIAAWDSTPQHRGPRQQALRAALHRLVRGQARRALPPSQLRRRAAQRSVRHPVARRLLVRRARTDTACSASISSARTSSSARSRAGARASSLAGCASTSTTSSTSASSSTSSRRCSSSPSTATSCLPDYRFDYLDRPLAPRARCGGASAQALGHPLRRGQDDRPPPRRARVGRRAATLPRGGAGALRVAELRPRFDAWHLLGGVGRDRGAPVVLATHRVLGGLVHSSRWRSRYESLLLHFADPSSPSDSHVMVRGRSRCNTEGNRRPV